MADPPETLQLAIQYHQQGLLAQAEAAYVQTLNADPNQAHAWHGLGVLAHQTGNQPAALEYLQKAVALAPHEAQFHANLGNVLQALERWEEAEGCYHRALKVDSSFVQAHFSLGNLYKLLNRLEDAILQFQTAVEKKPEYYQAWNNLGNVYQDLEQWPEAEETYRSALKAFSEYALGMANLGSVLCQQDRLPESREWFEQAMVLAPENPHILEQYGTLLWKEKRWEDLLDLYQRILARHPQFLSAHFQLGNVHLELKQPEAAIRCFNKVLAADPAHALAHHNLGSAYMALDCFEEAETRFRQALTLNPQFVEALNNLGNALLLQQRPTEALGFYQQALQLNPELPECHNNLGNVYEALEETDKATHHYQEAIGLKPDYISAHHNRALVLHAQGYHAEAMTHFDQVVALVPDCDSWRLNRGMQCPAIPCDQQEIDAALGQNQAILDEMLAKSADLSLEKLIAVNCRPSFHLTYTGENILPIRSRYADLLTRSIPELAPQPLPAKQPDADPRPKLGFLVTKRNEAIFNRLMAGILNGLSRELFRLHVICPPTSVPLIAPELQSPGIVFDPLPATHQIAVREIRQRQYDLIHFFEIGSDCQNYYLPYHRMAPVQCTSWGIPVTSGIATVDYYLSSRWFEPDDGNTHYRESLIALDALPVYFYKPNIPPLQKSRTDYGLPEEKRLYFCPQNLFKLQPEMDPLLAGILEADPQAQILLFQRKHPHHETILMDRFARTIPHAQERIRFFPWQQWEIYVDLLRLSDVVLDTLHFNGGITSLEAFAAGMPVVTLPGNTMRSRMTQGFYRKMGIDDGITTSTEDYIQLAVDIATHTDRREALKKSILSENHRLFEDDRVISEWEAFFTQAIATAQHSGCPV